MYAVAFYNVTRKPAFYFVSLLETNLNANRKL
jgi:hypothetical protein